MKKIFLVSILIILFGLAVNPAYAGSFSDNFDDGNADGWWLGYSQHTPWVDGNWRVENGVLVQDQGGDDFIALLENIQSSSQTTETQVRLNGPSGYGGITIWFQNDSNWVNIRIYPAASGVWITENINGIGNLFQYSYIAREFIWYDLKVNADSASGNLDIFINDVYLLTHHVTTTVRTGQSGVNSGNAGGYFDNFVLNSSPTDKTQCKRNGWKVFNNPTFKNQGACVGYI